jgi:hypothetical protein
LGKFLAKSQIKDCSSRKLGDFVGFQSPEAEVFFLAKFHNLENVFQKMKKKRKKKSDFEGLFPPFFEIKIITIK